VVELKSSHVLLWVAFVVPCLDLKSRGGVHCRDMELKSSGALKCRGWDCSEVEPRPALSWCES